MDDESKLVMSGTWRYDGTIPKRIEIRARPARFSASRYDSDDRLDESTPVPVTPDGFVYFTEPFSCERATAEDVMAWVNVQPWGPVHWDA